MGAVRAVFLCGILLNLLVLCSSDAEVTTVNILTAKKLLKQGHLYLDVRTEEEFKNGHVEKALNIPYMINTPKGMVKNPKFVDQVLSLCGKEDHLVLGCKSGVRSVHAATQLVNAEFKHVYNMGGGINAWIDNGFEVVKPHTEEL
ncbi:Rhodanese-like domain-containing protein 19-mitochondrial [Striga hermonthica]|uniref:Rhodanese-like domain-containing protein 19-mitochondrial n=1 Tax=Striga hermonthica TaxID=68872 RepID=A0A9N7N6Z2_STRHE|nr:Rhodanese-like domain-containing protein 19-mitochondrial [Striga hermonthica]